MTNATAQLFRDAADVIEKRGWYQGAYTDGGPPESCAVCALGALNVAAGRRAEVDAPDWAPSYIGFEDFLADRGYHYSIPSWNDEEERTAEEVVATFRAYADHLDAVA